MSPVFAWLLTVAVVAAVLYTAEIFIPSHGVFSIIATACVAVGVLLCFAIDRRLGLGAIVALAILGPVGITMGISVWQRTPVGRRMVLTATTGQPVRPVVLVGTPGVTLTELRPMGECEFDGVRIEARSEMGELISPGQSVRVISLENGVATVRPAASTSSNP